ncbi:MAG: biotin attachment protein [Ignavibacteria bacterium]|nr:biotin attachment protein [Ignavibacteria bacterium]
MIFTEQKKKINVHFTPFRDGLQSSFGGKVRLNDFLPAMEMAAKAGLRHLEFGGGARYQAPLFYLNEDPFETMKKIREAVGPDVDLQILTRSVSGVTLTEQSIESLQLQAKLMKEYGTTYDRNFDFMNDVRNLVKTGQPIVDAGMHHQVCIAMMGLPFESDTVHTSEYYINVGKQLLESDIHIDSICLKDASGTTDPKTVYDTAVGLKKIMPSGMKLWMHTHDTASMAVACYMAGIAGGVDGVDLSVRPMASGTVQADVRSLAHALKGTGYSLDIDVSLMMEIERMLTEGLKDYEFNPTTTTADARVLGFPMPGGAIGPNVHMMQKAGILDKYSEVLAEFPVVVEAGGAWTSVTPGSQQYWLQAFNNVMFGRWAKIDPGYGKSALGYFGRTPLPADPKVLQIASEQLNLPFFDGDPLAAAPNNIEVAKQALQERNLPINDKNIFLVLSAMVPGKKMEANEGIRFLQGKGKIDIPLKKKEEPVAEAPAIAAQVISGPQTTKCTVNEKGVARTFTVTIEPAGDGSAQAADTTVQSQPGEIYKVYSTFAGSVDIVDILVKVGDRVSKGQSIAQIEAMKAKFDIKSQKDGVVQEIYVSIGDEVDSSRPIAALR